MSTQEIQVVTNSEVSCSGKEYPLDHPQIYLFIPSDKGQVQCPYCSKNFKLKLNNKPL